MSDIHKQVALRKIKYFPKRNKISNQKTLEETFGGFLVNQGISHVVLLSICVHLYLNVEIHGYPGVSKLPGNSYHKTQSLGTQNG